MNQLDHDAYITKAAAIKLAVFDGDGVSTNGELILGECANEYKGFIGKWLPDCCNYCANLEYCC